MFSVKFRSILSCHHDLKKNGYKILKKLHKLELRANLDKAYSKSCPDGYFVVLACKNLAELLTIQYGSYNHGYIRAFLKRTEQFVSYLDSIAKKHARINTTYLSSYLSAYTEFFNRITNDKIAFTVNNSILTKWNIGCVMAYTAVWGS